jgi:site-specific DNA-methyltransferase (adenine-specific)
MSKPPFELHCEDALVALRTMKAESIDLVFADPPYFLSNDGFTVKSGQMASVNKGEWDRSLGFQEELEFHKAWIQECLRVLKPTGSLFISGTYHSIYKCGFLLQSLGARIVNDLVWFKPNGAPALAGRNFTASHETLIWATKSKNAKHFFDYAGSKKWVDSRDKLLNPGKQMRSVWSIPTTPAREKLIGSHPTQKPIALLERIITLCSEPAATVLDPFCGSGTTGVVSVTHGRRFIGIDLDPDYINLSRGRISEAYEANSNSK